MKLLKKIYIFLSWRFLGLRPPGASIAVSRFQVTPELDSRLSASLGWILLSWPLLIEILTVQNWILASWQIMSWFRVSQRFLDWIFLLAIEGGGAQEKQAPHT